MASSISVAVRVRPPTERERSLLMPTQSSSAGVFADGCLSSTPTHSSMASHRSLRPIIRVLDQRVLIFDPPESNPLQQAQRQILARLGAGKKVKDMRFCFDRVFDDSATQEDVYEGSAKDLVDGVLNGFNATVFAYGATGCGKTHTITGTPEAPGIVYLLMKDLFGRISDEAESMTAEVSISYLEIYNETIRDLLNPNAPILNLREANSSVSVPGLSSMTPDSAADVISLISTGNSHRTVHGTEANAVSSRSHAVLSVNLRRKPKTAGLIDDWSVATLSVIDLAGSERASATKNKGDRLLEGANINKSLLALGNCINALCDPKGRGGHVPYRNSKLTRLLKHSLGGNCRTLMIVCVAPTSAHYDETHNTLQYANRAKEIKTKATRNVISVDRHVSQYVQVIFQLRQELEERKKGDAARDERVKLEFRRSRLETDAALVKARKHWDDYMIKARPASYAKGRLAGLEQVRVVLGVWKETMQADPEVSPETNEWLGDHIQPLLSIIATEASSAGHIVEQGAVAKSMYEACVSSLGRTVERSSGEEGRSLFSQDVDGWAAGVGQMVLSSAENEGRAETLADLVGQVAGWLLDLSAQFLAKETSQQSCKRFGEATKAALQSLRKSSGPLPSTSVSWGQSTLLAPVRTSFQPPPSNKPDRSPPSPADTSGIARPVKARRPSAATSPLKSASVYYAKRSSPRKRVIFPPSRGQIAPHSGILKPRVVSAPHAADAGARAGGRTGTATGKAAGVRWRDEQSDGEERLESFDESSVGGQTMDSSSSFEAATLMGVPSLARSSNGIGSAAPDGERMCSDSGGGPRSSRMKAGYLSRHKSRLDSLGEEDEGEEPVRMSGRLALPASFSFATRPPLADTMNTGGSGGSSSGTTGEQQQHPRRQSLVGPIRKVKPARRQSVHNVYKRPGSEAGRVGLDARPMLRASRAPVAGGLKPEPTNMSMSPRKGALGGLGAARKAVVGGRRSMAVAGQHTGGERSASGGVGRRISFLPTFVGRTGMGDTSGSGSGNGSASSIGLGGRSNGSSVGGGNGNGSLHKAAPWR